MQHQHAPGQLTNLLRVSVEESVDAAVRQVAAITFKNLVKADWDVRGEQETAPPAWALIALLVEAAAKQEHVAAISCTAAVLLSLFAARPLEKHLLDLDSWYDFNR